MSQNDNDPAVLDERIASIVSTMIQVSDPRLVANALLGNASALCQLIIAAEKASPAMVAQVFGDALAAALQPRAAEAPRIEVVSANVIDLKTRK